LKKIPKYLDTASTTAVDPRVVEAMLPYFSEIFGNASSTHLYGNEAMKAVEKARAQVSNLLGVNNKEIIFTSCATEAINMALKGYVEANYEKGNHIITIKTEHKAVLATCEYLETKGVEVTYLDVDENGLISLQELKDAIRIDTLLISVMYVNNEIGVIQPIEDIGKIARENNIIFFCDATQAIGKVTIDIEKENIDMLSFSGHKINGPKGIGVLYKRNTIDLVPLLHGGSQENGLRAGTYNTPLIVGLGKACELIGAELEDNINSYSIKAKEIELYYEENNIGIVNFKKVKRAPHIVSITLKEKEAAGFLMINATEFAASTGSACSAGLGQKSHVLSAVQGLEKSEVIRISV
jgi:cysteine desulfurase